VAKTFQSKLIQINIWVKANWITVFLAHEGFVFGVLLAFADYRHLLQDC